MVSITIGHVLSLVLSVSTLASTSAVRPKCYTATVTVPPKVCPVAKCPPPLQCLRAETEYVTVPCPNSNCPATPTKTKTGTCTLCQTGCPTITSTVTSSPCSGCYTAITRVSPTSGCPPEPTDCIEIQCIEEIEVTEPCPNPNCPKTPTSTSTFPCKTACRSGCATGYVTVTPTCSA